MLSGASDEEVRAVLDKDVSANPTSRILRLARVNFDLQRHDAKSATTAAQAALSAIPRDPQLTDALASAQFMSGDANQAIETLKQLVILQPQNPAALLRLAQAQAATKDYHAAIESARKALVMKPDSGPGWALITKVYLASGRPEAAIADAQKLQKEYPDKAFGNALEAEILFSQKKYPQAADAFRAGLKREPASVLAARLYVALQEADKRNDAAAMAKQWLKDHPKDPTLLQLMAEQDQANKQYRAAADGYKRVLDIDADNVGALNNLAWVLTEENNPQALEYAERAHRIAPFNPNVLDTLGWTVVRTGDPKRGVQLLRMASSLSPGSSDIRLHLAKALMDAGDKPAAKKTLTELSKLDKDSPIRIEAEKLLATL
jgi:putative PEP-CTERM system TPR-repeat lipoprotein